MTLAQLRSWLGSLASGGAARATLSRRSAAVRTFFAWTTRTGRTATDPALRLASPKRQRTLPDVLSRESATAVLDVAAVAADDDDPIHLRNRAVLELLYATGIRVSELTGLDVDDVDRSRRVVRVLGKGRKERTVPYGAPADAALGEWLERGRPRVVVDGSGPALFLGRRGRRVDPRQVREVVHQLLAHVPDPVILVDRRTLVLEANPAARALLPALHQARPLSFALRDPEVLDGIRETGKLEDSTISALEAEIKTFRDSFVPSNKEDVPVGSAEESGDDAQDSEQVQIVKQKR